MNLPWFRLYAEFGTDPVIQSLSFEDQRHYVVLLCLKASGVLDRQGVSKSSRERIILRGLGLSREAARNFHRTAERRALLGRNWEILGWEKRQFPSDSSTERVRKYRKSQATGNVPGTIQNSSETVPETDQIQNRTEHITKSIYNPPGTPPLNRVPQKARNRASPRTTIPDEINFPLSTGMIAFLLNEAPEADAAQQWGHFRDYHTAKGDCMASWDAAWRTWCRMVKKFGRNGDGKKAKFDAGEYMLDKIRAQYGKEN